MCVNVVRSRTFIIAVLIYGLLSSSGRNSFWKGRYRVSQYSLHYDILGLALEGVHKLFVVNRYEGRCTIEVCHYLSSFLRKQYIAICDNQREKYCNIIKSLFFFLATVAIVTTKYNKSLWTDSGKKKGKDIIASAFCIAMRKKRSRLNSTRADAAAISDTKTSYFNGASRTIHPVRFRE